MNINKKKVAKIISDIAVSNDSVIFLGAGSISQWANDLPSRMRNLTKKTSKHTIGVNFDSK